MHFLCMRQSHHWHKESRCAKLCFFLMAFPLNPTKAGGTLKQRHVHKRLLLFLSTRLTGGLPEPLYISMANKCLWCWVPLVFRETIFVWFHKKHANNMGRFFFCGCTKPLVSRGILQGTHFRGIHQKYSWARHGSVVFGGVPAAFVV